MRRYTLAQIRGCLKELEREEKQRALVHLAVTSAAIGAALGAKEATSAIVKELSD